LPNLNEAEPDDEELEATVADDSFGMMAEVWATTLPAGSAASGPTPPPASRPLPSGDVPHVEILAGMGAGSAIELTKVEVAIGRSTRAGIRLLDSTVSRRHAVIVFADGCYRLNDCGAANGTFVNGDRIFSHVLEEGDTVVIGRTTLQFRLPPA
jgi:hypothetical protein